MRLEGMHLVVVGGSSGIGLETARAGRRIKLDPGGGETATHCSVDAYQRRGGVTQCLKS
jgi:hypothetical protein